MHSLMISSATPREHRALVIAVMERDEAAAAEALERHIRHTTDALLTHLQSEKD